MATPLSGPIESGRLRPRPRGLRQYVRARLRLGRLRPARSKGALLSHLAGRMARAAGASEHADVSTARDDDPVDRLASLVEQQRLPRDAGASTRRERRPRAPADARTRRPTVGGDRGGSSFRRPSGSSGVRRMADVSRRHHDGDVRDVRHARLRAPSSRPHLVDDSSDPRSRVPRDRQQGDGQRDALTVDRRGPRTSRPALDGHPLRCRTW